MRKFRLSLIVMIIILFSCFPAFAADESYNNQSIDESNNTQGIIVNVDAGAGSVTQNTSVSVVSEGGNGNQDVNVTTNADGHIIDQNTDVKVSASNDETTQNVHTESTANGASWCSNVEQTTNVEASVEGETAVQNVETYTDANGTKANQDTDVVADAEGENAKQDITTTTYASGCTAIQDTDVVVDAEGKKVDQNIYDDVYAHGGNVKQQTDLTAQAFAGEEANQIICADIDAWAKKKVVQQTNLNADAGSEDTVQNINSNVCALGRYGSQQATFEADADGEEVDQQISDEAYAECCWVNENNLSTIGDDPQKEEIISLSEEEIVFPEEDKFEYEPTYSEGDTLNKEHKIVVEDTGDDDAVNGLVIDLIDNACCNLKQVVNIDIKKDATNSLKQGLEINVLGTAVGKIIQDININVFGAANEEVYQNAVINVNGYSGLKVTQNVVVNFISVIKETVNNDPPSNPNPPVIPVIARTISNDVPKTGDDTVNLSLALVLAMILMPVFIIKYAVK